MRKKYHFQKFLNFNMCVCVCFIMFKQSSAMMSGIQSTFLYRHIFVLHRCYEPLTITSNEFFHSWKYVWNESFDCLTTRSQYSTPNRDSGLNTSYYCKIYVKHFRFTIDLWKIVQKCPLIHFLLMNFKIIISLLTIFLVLYRKLSKGQTVFFN